jgi:zinc finger HIT domain-containing protein 1
MPTIQELPITAKAQAAPGWAYVLEPALDPSKLAIQPLGARGSHAGKRTTGPRTATDTLLGNHSKTQAAKIRSRVDEISKDNSIPAAAAAAGKSGGGDGGSGGADGWIPALVKKEMAEGRWKITKGAGKGVGAGATGRISANVKRVLASTKTWVHHAADEESRLQLEAKQVPGRRPATAAAASQQKKTAATATAMMQPVNLADTSSSEGSEWLKVEAATYPSQEVVDALLRAPPLTYVAARAPASEIKTPARKFCDMCGYWGRLRCTVCGTPMCSLPCKVTHDAAEHPHR